MVLKFSYNFLSASSFPWRVLLLFLYSIFFPTTLHMYLSTSEFGQAEMREGAQGVVPQSPPPPSHSRMLRRAPAKVRRQGLAGSSVLRVCPGAHLAGPSSARLTQLIPVACARDSCQTVAAFWSLPAQDRFKLVSCWQLWISSLLLWMTFPLFYFHLELILLGRWYWYWLQQGLLNLESQGGWANQPHEF